MHAPLLSGFSDAVSTPLTAPLQKLCSGYFNPEDALQLGCDFVLGGCLHVDMCHDCASIRLTFI